MVQSRNSCFRAKPLGWPKDQVGAGFSRCPRDTIRTFFLKPAHHRTNRRFMLSNNARWCFLFRVRAEGPDPLECVECVECVVRGRERYQVGNESKYKTTIKTEPVHSTLSVMRPFRLEHSFALSVTWDCLRGILLYPNISTASKEFGVRSRPVNVSANLFTEPQLFLGFMAHGTKWNLTD